MHRISPNTVNLFSSVYDSGVEDDDVLDLPPFDREGYLPEGVYEACFELVIERFATNPIRKALCQRLERFLLTAIDSKNYSHAYIGGEFTTAKASPKEIEVILQIQDEDGSKSFQAVERTLGLSLDAIFKKYSVRLHFCSEGSSEGINDFQDPLLCLAPQETYPPRVEAGVEKGIVRIKL